MLRNIVIKFAHTPGLLTPAFSAPIQVEQKAEFLGSPEKPFGPHEARAPAGGPPELESSSMKAVGNGGIMAVFDPAGFSASAAYQIVIAAASPSSGPMP